MPLWSETPHELSVARACSSMRIASCANVPPPPPYSSGMDRQSRPTSPALFHRSVDLLVGDVAVDVGLDLLLAEGAGEISEVVQVLVHPGRSA
jgi:hypothetical protein